MTTSYNQRDPDWINHTLGHGGAAGTIGAYGCVETTQATKMTLAGHPITPPIMDTQFNYGKVYEVDPTGTYDYLPDDSLPRLYPAVFKWLGSYSGLNVAVADAALAAPDKYVEFHISTPAVPTHRVLGWGGSKGAYTIADPWNALGVHGALIRALSGYGPNAVAKTIVTQVLPVVAAKPAPVPPVAEPVPLPEKPPTPIPTEPMAFYDFVVKHDPAGNPDLHPMGGMMFKSVAITLANDWVRGSTVLGVQAQASGYDMVVVDAQGAVVYEVVAV